jgi:hypothetical protein
MWLAIPAPFAGAGSGRTLGDQLPRKVATVSKVHSTTHRATSSATRLSRSLCRTPDEADAENEHAGG